MSIVTLQRFLFISLLLAASTARAGTVTAKLDWPLNSGTVNVNINNGNGASPTTQYTFSGFIPWTQWDTSKNAAGVNNTSFSPTFYTFCIELTSDVYIGSVYKFNYTLNNLASSPNPGSAQTGGASGMGATKASEIAKLWNGFFNSALAPSNLQPYPPNPALTQTQLINAAAFQLAIWRIEYDWGNANLTDFTQGNFRASASGSNGALAITEAQSLLNSVIAGNGFYGAEAPNIVALTGSNFQDQITQIFPTSVPTPEPATLTLLGVGIAGMAGYGWRKRKPAAA